MQEPFRFCTSLVLQEATGLRAATLPQLVGLLRRVPEGCIYFHTHYFLLSHHYLTPEPTNDFAYWVSSVLGEEGLGEILAGIDILEHTSLSSLREKLARTIESYLEENPAARMRFASEGEEFFFIQSTHVVMPTPYAASSLEEFVEALSHVSIRSLYYHIFDARLRLGRPTNDFSRWFQEQLGMSELAHETAKLDPYAHTLEALRSILLSMLQRQLQVTGKQNAAV
ncbi:MAG: hypothetical protein HYY57_01390 [Candidatus Omnitrophica bacterium]|nr:hypothetical protein [Candidatus Omnitrophota bacterium]